MLTISYEAIMAFSSLGLLVVAIVTFCKDRRK